MGWMSLPRPGTLCGPCAGACEHVDCLQTRDMAETCCVVCGELIGYDRPFYDVGPTGKMVLAHTVCWVSRQALDGQELFERATPYWLAVAYGGGGGCILR
jgi:hypothetical protein